ncbi:MAG: hypothetical protein JWL96_4363 [Sphingomonas bacterium]|uniref:hypothetical protein n=1 Tax=Sphingomonas bacterium TaxID=1895847 RepID=UPI0026378A1D|nr:hypothetical protein [Sphingomonas bacterium]MDB5712293.1 hypothetical protein [Sphingomonas bacterium]
MKLLASTAALLTLIATPALAQTTPAPAAPATAPAAPAAAAPAALAAATRLNLDTPIETVVADAEGKKVLDTDLPGLTTNDKYDMFKSMSLNQVAGFAPDKLTPERLAKVSTDLAVIK